MLTINPFQKGAHFDLPNGIPIAVERTGRRKTASIQVNNGRVRALAPRNRPDPEEAGLDPPTTRIPAGLVPAVLRDYVDGEIFTYLGKRYRLRMIRGGERSASLIRDRLFEWHASYARARCLLYTRLQSVPLKT